MLILKVLTFLFLSFEGGAVEYVDSEYVIPENETPGVINTRCEEDYVPVHSRELLQRVQAWAVGAVFNRYSRKAKLYFDVHQYNEDNPHQGLFFFGVALGTTCLELDVLFKALSLDHSFRSLIRKISSLEPNLAEAVFIEKYLQLAEELGFDHYLYELPADPDVL